MKVPRNTRHLLRACAETLPIERIVLQLSARTHSTPLSPTNKEHMVPIQHHLLTNSRSVQVGRRGGNLQPCPGPHHRHIDPSRHDLSLPQTKWQYKHGFRIDVSWTRSGRALQFGQGGEKWRTGWSEVEEARGHAYGRPGWHVIRSRVTDSPVTPPAHTTTPTPTRVAVGNLGCRPPHVWSFVPCKGRHVQTASLSKYAPKKGGRASPARTCV